MEKKGIGRRSASREGRTPDPKKGPEGGGGGSWREETS